MAKRRHGTPGRYAIIAAALLCIALGALTACGRKEEPTETQLGIDGYVYVPRLIYTSADEPASAGETDGNTFNKVHSLKVLGNYLYYFRSTESRRILERLPLPEESAMPGVQGMDFGAGERLLELSGGYCEETEEMLEEWNRDPGLLIDRMMGKGEWLSGQISLQGHSYSGYVMDYTVDEEDNIYFTFSMGRYDGLEMVESRELLCRYGADGQLCYRTLLDGSKVNGMVPYGSGSLLLLAEDEIRKIDADGNVAERVGIEEYRSGRSISSERLYGEPGGRIYYVIRYGDLTWEVMELVAEGGMRLREVQGFAWKNNVDTGIQGCHDGDLYFTLHSDDTLYRFDGEEGAARKVLRWEDSDIFSSSIMQLWLVGEDRILARCGSGSGYFSSGEEWYLLDRTPVGELPEKELVVLASLDPGLDLRSAVVEYNRQSGRFHCAIEQYGNDSGTGDDTGASVRLDAELLSSSPPDILDLGAVDIYKYAEKGVLEDLSPYMEGSGTVRREDFLDGVLEGYTIGGSLVCVPTRFTLSTIVGRESQTNLLEGWGIEDVYMLMEGHPEMTELVSSGSRRLDGLEGRRAEGKGRDYMLKEFLPAYYLERFVDWEAGECSFDSGEFRELLLWLEGHVEKEQPETSTGRGTFYETYYVPEDALLMEARDVTFDTLLWIETQIGGKVRFLGFPTADGRGTAACRVMDKLGMVSNSLHKEGAWDFLEYYISRGAEDGYYLPTRISSLRDMAEKAAAPQPGMSTFNRSVWIGDDMHEVDEFPQYLADALMEQIEGMDFRPRSAAEEQIIEIVAEEADIYYKGDKSLEDVTAVIQNRVELLLKEAH